MANAGAPTRLRRYGWLTALLLIALWVLNVSQPGSRAIGCPERCSSMPPVASPTVRVMSLNVLHGFPRFHRLRERLDHIAMEIAREQADIVCLQEIPWRPTLGNAARYLAGKTGMNYAYVRANGNRWTLLFEEGEAVLSRYPLRDLQVAELRPRAGFFEHRVVLSARVSAPGGDLRLFITHLTHRDPQVNRAQAATLAEFVGQYDDAPGVVAGDLNAQEGSPQITALPWIDTYRTAHPDDPGYTCCIEELNAESHQSLDKRIDYLLLVPGEHPVAVVDSHLTVDEPFRLGDGWLWPSDHIGLLSELALEP